jgi:hypothetical protein
MMKSEPIRIFRHYLWTTRRVLWEFCTGFRLGLLEFRKAIDEVCREYRDGTGGDDDNGPLAA